MTRIEHLEKVPDELIQAVVDEYPLGSEITPEEIYDFTLCLLMHKTTEENPYYCYEVTRALAFSRDWEFSDKARFVLIMKALRMLEDLTQGYLKQNHGDISDLKELPYDSIELMEETYPFGSTIPPEKIHEFVLGFIVRNIPTYPKPYARYRLIKALVTTDRWEMSDSSRGCILYEALRTLEVITQDYIVQTDDYKKVHE